MWEPLMLKAKSSENFKSKNFPNFDHLGTWSSGVPKDTEDSSDCMYTVPTCIQFTGLLTLNCQSNVKAKSNTYYVLHVAYS